MIEITNIMNSMAGKLSNLGSKYDKYISQL